VHKLLFLGLLLGNASALADPAYQKDPFHDVDLEGTPLIYNQAHPIKRRMEVSLMYGGSVVDKYTSHQGLLLDLGYHFTDNVGIEASFGFMTGGLTSIVTDPQGILGNAINNCGTDCSNINPHLPDYRQITGIADALFIWSPLYGKINVVSEFSVNMQLYLLGGLGVNGTRQIKATAANGSYNLSGDRFMQGGMFSDPKFHLVGGVGLKMFVTEWMALRTEFRTLAFRDTFEFSSGKGAQGYFSPFWFMQGGISFLF
jgi:outer membrane beta-barrel protein